MIEQRTPEWHAQRLGKLTASRIADATARTKAGWGASRANYMAELRRERTTGNPYPRYVNASMERGIELEAEARAVYEFESNVTVQLCGFIDHPTIPMSGASPDGLVGADGLLEIKCPSSPARHDAILFEEKEIDDEYYKQMYWQMASTGRQWCDFVSYDPTTILEERIVIVRVSRDEKAIAKLEAEAIVFLNELADKVRGYRLDTMEQLRKSAAMA